MRHCFECNHPQWKTAIPVPRKSENQSETHKRNISVLIRIGYDIVLRLFHASPVIFLLRVHPSRQPALMPAEDFRLEPDLPVQYYLDSFGNHCGRLNASAGALHQPRIGRIVIAKGRDAADVPITMVFCESPS
jgi:hypothetical protein